jgi:hypothetical protein
MGRRSRKVLAGARCVLVSRDLREARVFAAVLANGCVGVKEWMAVKGWVVVEGQERRERFQKDPGGKARSSGASVLPKRAGLQLQSGLVAVVGGRVPRIACANAKPAVA